MWRFQHGLGPFSEILFGGWGCVNWLIGVAVFWRLGTLVGVEF